MSRIPLYRIPARTLGAILAKIGLVAKILMAMDGQILPQTGPPIQPEMLMHSLLTQLNGETAMATVSGTILLETTQMSALVKQEPRQ